MTSYTTPQLDIPRPHIVRTIPVKCGCDILGNGTSMIPDSNCKICHGSGIKYIREDVY